MSASVVRPADRDAQRAVGVDAHGLEHGRRLERLGRAGAARVGGDAGLVEAEQHGLGLDAVDAEADEVGEPVDGVAVDAHAVERRRTAASTRSVSRRAASASAAERAVGRQRRGTPRRGRRAPARSRARPGGPAPGRRRSSSGAQAQPAAHEQRAGAGRAAELVAADRQQVGAELVEVDRHVAGGLRRRRRAPARPRSRHARHDLGHRLDACRPRGCPTARGPARCRAAIGGRAPRRRRPGRGASTPDHGDRRRAPASSPRLAHRRVLDRGQHDLVRGPRSAAPHTAAAMASVAPLVNTTSRRRAPSSAATCSRACSSATRAAMPSAWMRPGSPPSPARPSSHVDHGLDAPRAAAATWTRGRGSAGPRRGQRAQASTAVTQTSSPMGMRRLELGGGVAVERAEHALDHAPVDRADHRVLDGGVAERAVLADDAQLVAVLLGVGREAVGGERVGHRVQRGAERALARRAASPMRRGHDPAVLDADLLGHGLGLRRGGSRASARPSRVIEQVVVADRELERRPARR